MEDQTLLIIIKEVAKEQNYEVTEVDKEFTINIKSYNTVSFKIWKNSDGYIQIHQLEYTDDGGKSRYGRAVYSLRNISDVIQFCSIIISSSQIRAKR